MINLYFISYLQFKVFFEIVEEAGLNFLLSKIVNGYLEVFRCPPLNRLFVTPRENALQNWIEKFPHESKNQIKKREKGSRVLSSGLDILFINIHRCRQLAVRDELIQSSEYCFVFKN